MSQPIPSETIEYERYVDGLRRENAELLLALKAAKSELEAWHSGANTRKGLKSMNDAKVGCCFGGLYVVSKALSRFGYKLPAAQRNDVIAIHIEGGLVQGVAGIPAGYELRVEDYDTQDPGDESWDAEKKCVVTVYEGAAA